MTTVGIDIGGQTHVVARCRDGESRADREVLRMTQDRAGLTALDAWLARQPEPVTLVTMESSGHYWMPLASHLRRHDMPLAVVNPVAAKYFAKSRLGRAKSDPADARSLAEMAMRDAPSTRDPLQGAELRQAARFAMTLVDEQARVTQVGLLLDQYDLLEAQIEAADRRVAGLLDGELARRLQTIPGVGPSTTATPISEIGDVSRFDDVDHLLAYAGVHPAERSSGTKGANPETSWHMSKAGNSHLRAAAHRMALVGISHNPVIAAHYERKRAAGKSKMNALGHCMRKSLSLVWGVWRNGVDFDPDWETKA